MSALAEALVAAKQAPPCRVCRDPASNGSVHSRIQLHHLVARAHGGGDVADNIVPLCEDCHPDVTRRVPATCRKLLSNLSDAEYAYMIERGGEDYPERAYGVSYER